MIFSHTYGKIKVNSYDSSPLEKTLTFHNVRKHIKSVWNKDQNHYSFKIFLKNIPINYRKIKVINQLLY